MDQQKVIACYNATANEYAASLFDELSAKPLDRLLLKQFGAENAAKGRMIDLGCGPGQTTRFLWEHGVAEIIGTDIASGMIERARQLNPDIPFQTADMLNLDFAAGSFASAIAFYAIVHFNTAQLKTAFSEISRVLVNGGQLLLSFHIGDEIIHRDELFGINVDIDFCFFRTAEVLALLKEAGFRLIDAIERYPYENVEHQSKRAYLWVQRG